MSKIVSFTTTDIRFQTSLDLDGSDAMNPDPDYSAAYVVIKTDAQDGHEGHGFAFTIGRGNDVQVSAIQALEHYFVGKETESFLDDMGETWQMLVHDSQLRWLGPEKGVMHMAIGAVINALWDLRSKRAGQPLWLHLAKMTPSEIVSLVDFRYLTDALTPQEALEILQKQVDGREYRIQELLETGYPGYTTSPGWLGYDDEKLARLCREAIADGFSQIKLKVGADLEDDKRRLRVARETVGANFPIAIDANQRWGIQEAIDWVKELEEFDIKWVEEPTSPDEILGLAKIAAGISPIPIATGEHVQNRIVFKQLLQEEALGFLQIDSARVAGVNENIAILLLAAKFGVPVCPHAGGVGLCEAVQHISMFDYISVSGSKSGRVIEFVDHQHEHFVTPVIIQNGNYVAPTAPGAGTEMIEQSILENTFDTEVGFASLNKAAGL
ncbi:MAG: enolase C-terminal domain-like protein [Aurantimicrobium sp.]|uniref:enolase C-terminal domain-like protein n=1 Tax=Aurantimicrobium sp. TaxID=1930784 RepID=UPI002FC9CFCB